MKIYKKPLLICVSLVIYVTGMAIYLVPRNQEMSVTEKTVTLVAAYLLVAILWLVLQYKEKLKQNREKGMNIK